MHTLCGVCRFAGGAGITGVCRGLGVVKIIVVIVITHQQQAMHGGFPLDLFAGFRFPACGNEGAAHAGGCPDQYGHPVLNVLFTQPAEGYIA